MILLLNKMCFREDLPDMKKYFAYILTALVLTGSYSSKVYSSDKALREKRIKMHKEGMVKKWSKRLWTSAYVYNTTHYNIKSNTSYQTCRYIGNIMELIYNKYRDLFSYKRSLSRLKIYAYASMEDFRKEANKIGVSQAASGFFTPRDGGAIHLPYMEIKGQHPSIVLYHEGAHQFVNEAIHMKIPSQYQKYFNKEYAIAPSTPIWLNEGLATYLETVRYNGRDLDIGRINASRLSHLQYMIKHSINPDVEEVLTRKYGQPFSAEHYAVAWALVYYLRHDAKLKNQKVRRKKLKEYIESAKKGFFKGDYKLAFRDKFIKKNKLSADYDREWRVHIGRSSFEKFQEIVIGKRVKFKDWESNWIKWVKELDPNSPYGGTYTGKSKTGGNF
jgi:hypothetical protein